MNKEAIISKISEKTAYPRKIISEILNELEVSIKEALRSGEKVSFQGFGSFKMKDRKERTCRNPKTGEPVLVPARKTPVFVAGASLKRELEG